MYEFLYKLFEANETRRKDYPGTMPLSNDQIKAMVIDQFSAFNEVIDTINNCRVDRVAVWRSVYNRGKMGTVKLCSFRYDGSSPFPVDNQTGLCDLSKAEQKEIALRYGIDDCRFKE